jgi:hypothetical protein
VDARFPLLVSVIQKGLSLEVNPMVAMKTETHPMQAHHQSCLKFIVMEVQEQIRMKTTTEKSHLNPIAQTYLKFLDGTTGIFPRVFKPNMCLCFISSNSISMLPSAPKIFHGRHSELQEIVEILNGKEPARIAILGGVGMGKSCLAKAALHHPAVEGKYQQRFFVSADSARTSVELATLIEACIGLKPGGNPTRLVTHYFSRAPTPCILILDNLERSWEPCDSRGAVEDFLALLSDVPGLALMVSTTI